MAEIINLRRARKQAKRSAAEAEAQRNRDAHGVPKVLKTAAATERAKQDLHLDAHRLNGKGRNDATPPR